LDGDAGDDVLRGGAGNDDLRSYLGINTLEGGSGDDDLWTTGSSTANGGYGSDRCRGGVQVSCEL